MATISVSSQSWAWTAGTNGAAGKLVVTLNMNTTAKALTVASYTKNSDNKNYKINPTVSISSGKLTITIDGVFYDLTDFKDLTFIIDYLNQSPKQFYKVVLNKNSSDNTSVLTSSTNVTLKTLSISPANGFSYQAGMVRMINLGDPISDANGYSDNILGLGVNTYIAPYVVNISTTTSQQSFFDGFFTGSGATLTWNYVTPFDSNDFQFSEQTTREQIKKKIFYFPGSSSSNWKKMVYTPDGNGNYVLSTNTTVAYNDNTNNNVNLHAPTGYTYTNQALLTQNRFGGLYFSQSYVQYYEQLYMSNGNLYFRYEPDQYTDSSMLSIQIPTATENWNTQLYFFGTDYFVLKNFKDVPPVTINTTIAADFVDSRNFNLSIHNNNNQYVFDWTPATTEYTVNASSVDVKIWHFSGYTNNFDAFRTFTLKNNLHTLKLHYSFIVDGTHPNGIYQYSSQEVVEDGGESGTDKSLTLNTKPDYQYSNGSIVLKRIDSSHVVKNTDTLDRFSNPPLKINVNWGTPDVPVYYYSALLSDTPYLKFIVTESDATQSITMFKTSPGGYYVVTTDDVESTGTGTGADDATKAAIVNYENILMVLIFNQFTNRKNT